MASPAKLIDQVAGDDPKSEEAIWYYTKLVEEAPIDAEWNDPQLRTFYKLLWTIQTVVSHLETARDEVRRSRYLSSAQGVNLGKVAALLDVSRPSIADEPMPDQVFRELIRFEALRRRSKGTADTVKVVGAALLTLLHHLPVSGFYEAIWRGGDARSHLQVAFDARLLGGSADTSFDVWVNGGASDTTFSDRLWGGHAYSGLDDPPFDEFTGRVLGGAAGTTFETINEGGDAWKASVRVPWDACANLLEPADDARLSADTRQTFADWSILTELEWTFDPPRYYEHEETAYMGLRVPMRLLSTPGWIVDALAFGDPADVTTNDSTSLDYWFEDDARRGFGAGRFHGHWVATELMEVLWEAAAAGVRIDVVGKEGLMIASTDEATSDDPTDLGYWFVDDDVHGFGGSLGRFPGSAIDTGGMRLNPQLDVDESPGWALTRGNRRWVFGLAQQLMEELDV